MKTTRYFEYTRRRPDRARIHDEWINQAVHAPVAERIQSDGRVQRWAYISAEGRYLRVILLEDRETGPQRLLRPQVPPMKVKYYKDTDTALLEFSDAPVDETREITESIYVDLDKDGHLVSMTIEHAAERASLPRVQVQEIDAKAV